MTWADWLAVAIVAALWAATIFVCLVAPLLLTEDEPRHRGRRWWQ